MLFRKRIEPSCTYCQRGIVLGFGEVMCKKRGIVSESSKCGTFRYDPTKRVPEFARSLKTPDIPD